MGHYYSEMVSDKEYREKIERHEKWMKNRAKKIKEAIEKHGIEMVLAEIIEDPTHASINYSGHGD